ncbi:MAG: 2-keto-3-deoxy-L-arabinonate dehydratase [Candidatus Azotimanducaceae bacterium]|jgi:2-keto-3-deoxy-L-arabinonate dehydratase
MPSDTDSPLHGVLPVLHTPFTSSGEIDVESLQAEIDWAFKIGADGVVIGMVSEVLRLGYEARRNLMQLVMKGVAAATGGASGYSVISVGAESIYEAVESARYAEGLGASAVMAVPPIATSLDGPATRSYFAAIASSISIPLVVQDASNYVGASIDLSVYGSLLDEFGPDQIYFKPEASPLGPNLSKLRDATKRRARIFEGSGGMNLVDCHRRGIAGTMPGTDLLDAIVPLWQALEVGDDDRAYELSLPLCGIVALQLQAGLDGFLAIEKYLLCKRGLFKSAAQVQPVGWQMDPETQAEVDRLFERLQSVI